MPLDRQIVRSPVSLGRRSKLVLYLRTPLTLLSSDGQVTESLSILSRSPTSVIPEVAKAACCG